MFFSVLKFIVKEVSCLSLSLKSEEHGQHHNAEAIYILGFEVLVFCFYILHLRCNIHPRANKSNAVHKILSSFSVRKLSGQTKVSYFSIIRLIRYVLFLEHKEVLRFDISVSDVHAVQLYETSAALQHKFRPHVDIFFG